MSKSKFVINKLAKLFEQGLVSYKDLSSEILNICDLITNIDESCYFVSTERHGSYPCANSVVFWKA